MVVDHGVDQRGANQWPVAAAAVTGAVSRRSRVGLAVLAAHEPVASVREAATHGVGTASFRRDGVEREC